VAPAAAWWWTSVGDGGRTGIDVMTGVNCAYGSMRADVIRGGGDNNYLDGRKGDDVMCRSRGQRRCPC